MRSARPVIDRAVELQMRQLNSTAQKSPKSLFNNPILLRANPEYYA
jgi:hypothetical protein